MIGIVRDILYTTTDEATFAGNCWATTAQFKEDGDKNLGGAEAAE